MNVLMLGETGQLSIPRSALPALGVEDEQVLTVEISDDGAIVLRPPDLYAVER